MRRQLFGRKREGECASGDERGIIQQLIKNLNFIHKRVEIWETRVYSITRFNQQVNNVVLYIKQAKLLEVAEERLNGRTRKR